MFKGSLVALITPYKDGSLDEEALEKLVQWHIAEGTQGILACGSTGEGALLSHAEQKRVLTLCVRSAGDQLPIIANASAIRLEDALALARQAQETGVQGLMFTPPPYIRPTQEAIYQFMKTVHDETHLPIIVYDNPGRCGVVIAREIVARLGKLPRIITYKDSTGDITGISELTLLAPSSFTFLCGDDPLNAAFLAQGGQGWISVAANAAPRLYAQFYQAWEQGNLKEFARLRDQLAPLNRAISVETSPSPVKYAVAQQGFCSDEVRRPLLKATAMAREAVDRALEHAGIKAAHRKVGHG